MSAKPNRAGGSLSNILCAIVQCPQSVPLESRSTTTAIAKKLDDGENDEVQLQWTDPALMNQPSAPESVVRQVQKLHNGCRVAKKLVK